MTAKILCKRHNSDLSPLDQEAGKLADLLLIAARGNDVERRELSGLLIERWAFKTLMSGLAAGWSDERKWVPSESIVRYIFGQGGIPSGCGLYTVDGDISDLLNPQDVSITPVWSGTNSNTKVCLGGYIRMHGLQLFVAIYDQAVEQIVGRLEGPRRVFENDDKRFVYRPEFVRIGAEENNNDGVIFRW